jgi:hypothetical protein
LLSDLPIPANPMPDSARTIKPARTSDPRAAAGAPSEPRTPQALYPPDRPAEIGAL